MIYRIDDLDSLSDTLRTRLIAAGVKNTRHILERCATAEGRARLARESAVPEAHILHCTYIADLLRVKGVGDGYAALLVAAGVPGVAALKSADAAALEQRLAAAKSQVKHVERRPNVKEIIRWIEDAGSLTVVFT